MNGGETPADHIARYQQIEAEGTDILGVLLDVLSADASYLEQGDLWVWPPEFLEDGIFPHLRTLTEPDELEEERRLAYVGITRAMERLHLTNAWSRTLFGGTQYNPPSRFLDEIPEALVEEVGGRRRASRGGRTYGAGGRSRSADVPEGRVFGRGGRDDGSERMSEGRDRIVENALAARDRPPASTGAESLGLQVGDDVHHATFGDGVILDISGADDKAEATIRFADAGEKRLLLSWSPLEKR